MSHAQKCGRCGETKPLDEFYAKGRNRIQSLCKPCLCKAQIDRWIERKIRAIEFLGGKCAHCGYCKNYAVLEFHHQDPAQKEFSWNKLRLRNWVEVEKELGKCLLLCRNCLCRNCHSEHHHPHALLPSRKAEKD